MNEIPKNKSEFITSNIDGNEQKTVFDLDKALETWRKHIDNVYIPNMTCGNLWKKDEDTVLIC